MIRVACRICRTDRLIYPSKVRNVQLCSNRKCRAAAKRTGLIPPGGRPPRPLILVDGVQGLHCKSGHWAPLTDFYLHAAAPEHGQPKPWRSSRCKPCLRARERELERGHSRRRRVERLIESRPVAHALQRVPPPAFDDVPIGEW